jgi:hypothetical protein
MGGSKVRLHQRRHQAEGGMTACGTELPIDDVRATVAIGGEAENIRSF